MNEAYVVLAAYCAMAALCGGASHRVRPRTVFGIAAAVIVGLIGVDLVVFNAPDSWPALIDLSLIHI